MVALVDALKNTTFARAEKVLGLTPAGTLTMTSAYQQAFYPARGTGDDATAIQAALDAADAAIGIVDLGNYVWNLTKKITLNSATTSLVGAGAVMSWAGVSSTLDAGLLVTQPVGAANRGKNITQRIQGIRFRGGTGATPNTNIARGVYLYAATNPNQETAQIAFYDCNFGGFVNNVEIADNAYICKWYHCSFDHASNATLYRIASANNGESMSFFGCTFGNAPRCLQLIGPNQDFYFYGCSFDYPTDYFFFIQSGTAEFHGCHFEGDYSSSSDMMQIQDDSQIAFYGGAFSMKGTNPRQGFLQCWGGNAGKYTFVGTNMGITFASGGQLCAKPECLVLVGTTNAGFYGKYLPTSGTANFSAHSSDVFYSTLTGNLTIANPTHESSNRRLTFVLKQAASGGPFTVSWGNKFVFTAGTPTLSTTANALMIVDAIYVATEAKWYARVQ